MCKRGVKEVKTHDYDKAAFFEVTWNLWNRKNINDRLEQVQALKRSMTGWRR